MPERATGRVLTKHKDLVDWLEADHGIGHGHATALVGYAPAQRAADEGAHQEGTDQA
jgi:hypothetical protein